MKGSLVSTSGVYDRHDQWEWPHWTKYQACVQRPSLVSRGKGNEENRFFFFSLAGNFRHYRLPHKILPAALDRDNRNVQEQELSLLQNCIHNLTTTHPVPGSSLCGLFPVPSFENLLSLHCLIWLIVLPDDIHNIMWGWILTNLLCLFA